MSKKNMNKMDMAHFVISEKKKSEVDLAYYEITVDLDTTTGHDIACFEITTFSKSWFSEISPYPKTGISYAKLVFL